MLAAVFMKTFVEYGKTTAAGVTQRSCKYRDDYDMQSDRGSEQGKPVYSAVV